MSGCISLSPRSLLRPLSKVDLQRGPGSVTGALDANLGDQLWRVAQAVGGPAGRWWPAGLRRPQRPLGPAAAVSLLLGQHLASCPGQVCRFTRLATSSRVLWAHKELLPREGALLGISLQENPSSHLPPASCACSRWEGCGSPGYSRERAEGPCLRLPPNGGWAASGELVPSER